MRRWQQISGITLGLLLLISEGSSALAQGDENLPPVLGDVLLKLATVFDGLLNFWVNSTTGNTLTDSGELFVSAIAELARNVVLFFAEFFEALTFG